MESNLKCVWVSRVPVNTLRGTVRVSHRQNFLLI